MTRDQVEQAKAEIGRFLDRVDLMERCAGWSRYTRLGDQKSSDHHPDDVFNSGQYTAAVKRASMDLSRSLAILRK